MFKRMDIRPASTKRRRHIANRWLSFDNLPLIRLYKVQYTEYTRPYERFAQTFQHTPTLKNYYACSVVNSLESLAQCINYGNSSELSLFNRSRCRFLLGEPKPIHSFAKRQSSPLSVLSFCSCDMVYHKQEVCFLLYELGQIVTWQT